MKNTISILGLSILVVNVLLGLLLSSYLLFNIVLNSIIIVIATLLIRYLIGSKSYKAGFKVSMPFIFAFLTMVQLILGTISANHVQDNWCIITIAVIYLFEFILIAIAKFTSNIN